MLTDPAHHARKVPVWGQTKGTTLGDAKHISMRTVFDGDRLVGFWEWDPDAGAIVFSTFAPLPAARRKLVEAAARELGSLLRDDLGHAKSFSLDTALAIKERAAIVKAL